MPRQLPVRSDRNRNIPDGNDVIIVPMNANLIKSNIDDSDGNTHIMKNAKATIPNIFAISKNFASKTDLPNA